ncbi:NACHT, LRR and PYD domains-containing protein 3-like isoform X2 [Periophthalmus magnuspinnatus]|uniref:NACHT, LRR and PYD domains-containing protein 3-like isoform X2 n=1 Tax=Periophthalmus magnuspinnatus TaxID=409849 RepID=UPI0024372309|nr:NACHT, LRR and PYD domains-containing protein 3-like isoform X2 [Periophthalmus magnuspinnatus]
MDSSSDSSSYNMEPPGPGHWSKPRPKPAPSSVSLKSDRSKGYVPDFREAPPEDQSSYNMEPPGPGHWSKPRPKPAPSSVSLKSDRSKGYVPDFREAPPEDQSSYNMEPPGPGPGSKPRPKPALNFLSLKSDRSIGYVPDFRKAPPKDQREPGPKEQLDAIFRRLEENVLTFVKEQLQRLHRLLASDYPECSESEEEEQSSREAVLNITLDFLRRMDQEQLAQRLQDRNTVGVCRDKMKRHLQQRFSRVFEGVAKAGDSTLLTQIYTELYITEGGASEVNQEHEVRHMETSSRRPASPETTITCEDLFKHPEDRHRAIRAEEIMEESTRLRMFKKAVAGLRPIRAQQTKRSMRTETKAPIRTVLTKGVAGVGKTVMTQKFSLDWAEGRANQDLQLLFPFTLRELNVLRDTQFSLVGLLHHFFSLSKGLCSFQQLPVLFIFDGLDECRLPLDFSDTRVLTDPTESTSVHVLLVNLIRGSLLPFARIWITTRAAAANQIPAECVSMVTEVRGFTDPQKEQYFRKRFRDQATAVISHIKSIRSLHIMSHIPIFCWILSTVIQKLLKQTEKPELPRTLTQMYIHFLVVQAKAQNIKYHQGSGVDLHWTPETREMVLSLAKLAFEQLQKRNLIFYECNLSECGLDAAAASVYSGVFTQVFREEPGLYQDKVYCFIHLSVQEFLAALHVHQTFTESGVNLLEEQQTSFLPQLFKNKTELSFLHRSAVDQALQSPNGHLDLFLRFLLGLSLPTNQSLLQGLLTQTGSDESNRETAEYIKEKLNEEGLSGERSLNLLHCLNELNDHSLVKEIQEYMRRGQISRLNSPALWVALSFLLLSSESDLEEFDLRKYWASETAFLGLLPVVKASTKALLIGCGLSPHSCGPLASVLSSSSLTHLDLSHNNLQDSGVEQLCAGLQSAPCRLKTLSLCGCGLSPHSSDPLASVLSSSSLTHLDLSHNDLQDSGVEKLCFGLKNPPCRLETLRLSGCLVSERGGAALVSALSSAPFRLRALDLSYNHPGPSAELLTAVWHNPDCPLQSLRLDPAGEQWMVPGLRKYSCEFSLDPNTAHRKLKLSKDKQTVTCAREEQQYPDHEDRFTDWYQVLSCTGLKGCCYWEVQWSGCAEIAVSYKGIRRRGETEDCRLGDSDQSWSLRALNGRYYFCHNRQTALSSSFFSSFSSRHSGRVSVFLDSEAGSLSFFEVRIDGELFHLHTFSSSFTEPLFPGFGFGELEEGDSVSVVDLR